MRTADDYIRWYFRTRDSFGAPSLNAVDSTGRMFAERCGNLHHGKVCRSADRVMDEATRWVCLACESPWPYVDRIIFKGEVQRSPRTEGLQTTTERWVDVGAILHRFMTDPLWILPARVFIARAHGFTARDVVARWYEIFPDQMRPASERTVQRRVEEARVEFARRLALAGFTVADYNA